MLICFTEVDETVLFGFSCTVAPKLAAMLAHGNFAFCAVHVRLGSCMIWTTSQWCIGTSIDVNTDVTGSQLVRRMNPAIAGSAKNCIICFAVDHRRL
mmetsp:Transcript_63994/g.132596  ORF Transcript_63994/g.132596 Transcript_63994/m.132596 type:complete len:97 (+) Transcript_63994:695-985(+)